MGRWLRGMFQDGGHQYLRHGDPRKPVACCATPCVGYAACSKTGDINTYGTVTQGSHGSSIQGPGATIINKYYYNPRAMPAGLPMGMSRAAPRLAWATRHVPRRG